MKDLLAQDAAQTAADKVKFDRRNDLVGKGMLAALALAVVAVLAVAVMSDSDDESGRDPASAGAERSAPSEFGAEVACEDYVEDMLKSPSTAEFSEQERTRLSDTEFWVRGAVDSQNGFGATVRSQWSCKVRQQGGQWSLMEPVSLRQR